MAISKIITSIQAGIDNAKLSGRIPSKIYMSFRTYISILECYGLKSNTVVVNIAGLKIMFEPALKEGIVVLK